MSCATLRIQWILCIHLGDCFARPNTAAHQLSCPAQRQWSSCGFCPLCGVAPGSLQSREGTVVFLGVCVLLLALQFHQVGLQACLRVNKLVWRITWEHWCERRRVCTWFLYMRHIFFSCLLFDVMQYMVICITLFCSRFQSNDGAAQPCAAAGGVCVLAAASGTECSWFRGIWRCLGFIGFEMKVYDVTRVFGLAMIPCFYYFGGFRNNWRMQILRAPHTWKHFFTKATVNYAANASL